MITVRFTPRYDSYMQFAAALPELEQMFGRTAEGWRREIHHSGVRLISEPCIPAQASRTIISRDDMLGEVEVRVDAAMAINQDATTMQVTLCPVVPLKHITLQFSLIDQRPREG